MPGTTPNRGYNYPVPGDATNTAADIERLATQVDSDVEALEWISRPRPMAQFFGSVPNTIPGTAVSGLLTWQTQDFNTRAISGAPEDHLNGPTAVEEITGTATTALRVQYSGFWMVHAAAQLQSKISASGIDSAGIELVWSGAPSVVTARHYTHDITFAADRTHLLDLSWGLFMNAGDTISLRGVVGRSSLSNTLTFENRSITLLRMTET